MSSAYSAGMHSIQRSLGLKVSSVVTPTGEGASMAPIQAGTVAAAGAAPFAGMIGQKKLIHDPMQGAEGAQYKNMKELSKASRPGDVLVTTKPKGSVWKNFVAPFAGSEFYHAQPVVGRAHGMGTTLTAGEHEAKAFKNMSRKELAGAAEFVQDSMKANEYSNVALMRPKGMTNAQRKAVSNRNIDRSVRTYDTAQAVKAWIKELFVPKIPGLEKLGPQTICQGNVCSTMPAMSAQEVAGKGVVPGKAAKDVFPTDYLRSSEYELVGSKIDPKEFKMNSKMRKALPYLTRGAIGAGLAGTVYGVTEQPEMVGAAAGGFGAARGVEKIISKAMGPSLAQQEKLFGQVFPDSFTALATALDKSQKDRGRTLKAFGTRKVPVALGGAALGYLGAGALKDLAYKHLVDKKRSTS